MSLLTKLGDFLSGGLGSTLVETVKDYFPPSMSEQEKANLSHAIQLAADKKEIELRKLANDQDAEFNKRIKDMEGTTKDLQSIPILGPMIIFARGAQRPVWGFATLYMDYMVFSGQWSGLTEQNESALWVINLLVLGFLFGERAVKNVGPIITQMIQKKPQ